VTCRGDCLLDYSACSPIIQSYCGDNAANLDEEACDGEDLRNHDCADLGFHSGVLSCTPNCVFDTSQCNTYRGYCGDGTIQTPNQAGFDEQCDTETFGDVSICPPRLYSSGSVACAGDCTVDYSGCIEIKPPVCGDGAVNALDETCDGTDFGGATCASLGFESGDLSCTNCQLVTSDCRLTPQPKICGDNIVQAPNDDGINEECDGSVPSSASCDQFGYAFGNVMCIDCQLNAGTCSACNNNGVCQPRMGETENCAGDCIFAPDYLSLFFNPQSIDIAAGDTVTFDIKVSSMTNLYSYQFDVNYNPATLEFISLTDGGFLSTSPFCVEYSATSGLIKNVACTRMGTSGVSGSGALKRISFRALASGTNSIWLSNVKVLGLSSVNELTEIRPETIGADVSVS
jgi:hypothetical protein